MDKKIAVGIIGVGNMGTSHVQNIMDGKCPELKVVAVADRNPDRLAWVKKQFPNDNIACFATGEEMIESGLLEACVVAVPHYDHTKYAIMCIEKGIHVMVEKPAGVYTKQVREMNEAAEKHPEVVSGMMFNQRTNHIYRKMKELVHSGEYGEIRRTNWLITSWYRPQAYYDSGDWRATWAGEGGGVLLNQAPHQLDLWQWICGMPKSITAFCDVAKYHNIEVEDDVTIFARYENGSTGLFVTTTGEYPGTNILEISGSLGKLVLENGTLKWWKLSDSEREFCFTSPHSSPRVDTQYEEFRQEKPEEAHKGILQNFANTILRDDDLLAPGYEGINELSVSGAAYLSAWTGNSEIQIPFDEAKFDELLSLMVEKSAYKNLPLPKSPRTTIAAVGLLTGNGGKIKTTKR